MQVKIKSFDVDMDVKTRGIEFQVKSNDGKHLGDLILNKAHLVWCKGRTTRRRGVKITWEEFVKLMQAEA